MAMQRVKVETQSTFSLMRIDPVVVLKKYTDGYFRTAPIPRASFSIGDQKDIIKKAIETSIFSDVYTYKNRSNADIIVATTNCEQFKAYNLSTNAASGGRCRY